VAKVQARTSGMRPLIRWGLRWQHVKVLLGFEEYFVFSSRRVCMSYIVPAVYYVI